MKFKFFEVGKISCLKNFYHLGKEVDYNLMHIKILEKIVAGHNVDYILICLKHSESIHIMEFVKADIALHIFQDYDLFVVDKVNFTLLA